MKQLGVCLLAALPLVLLAACGGGNVEPALGTVARPMDVQLLHPDLQGLYTPGRVPSCTVPLQCGSTVAIDCGSAGDGPKNYYDHASGQLLMRCGGACLLPQFPGVTPDPLSCARCPPAQWTCS